MVSTTHIDASFGLFLILHITLTYLITPPKAVNLLLVKLPLSLSLDTTDPWLPKFDIIGDQMTQRSVPTDGEGDCEPVKEFTI